MAGDLAINGGEPEVTHPLSTRPVPEDEIASALQATYVDGSWSGYDGPSSRELESLIAEMQSVEHAYLCASGTVAVELALRGAGISSGDEVLLAAYDFAGNYRAIEAVGARPVLLDIDPVHWALDLNQADRLVGPETKAVLVSHLHGAVAPMDDVKLFADRHQLRIIEDACQAPGATIGDRPLGTFGDLGVWSFGGSKLLSAGRGGAVFTNDDQAIQRIRIHCERGNHYCPLSELQAAVLVPQLRHLVAANASRLANVQTLLALIQDIHPHLRPANGGLTTDDAVRPAYYKLGFQLDLPSAERESVVTALKAEGVPIDAGFRGFVKRRRRCRSSDDLSYSQKASESMLVLHHTALNQSGELVDQIARALDKVVRHFLND